MAVSENSQPDHYATLRLSPDATGMDVENAFHARVREHLQHANVADKPIRERARQVGLAYETLRDPAKRRAYDDARAAAAIDDRAATAETTVTGAGLASPSYEAARVPPSLTMFTPPQTVAPAEDEPLVPRSEPNPVPTPAASVPEPKPELEPEPETIDAYTPVEPVDQPPPAVVPTPIEPVAAEPIAEPEPEIIRPEEPVAEESAEPTSNWRPAAASIVPLTFVDAPRADDSAIVPWRTKRPKRRGLLAVAALVAVLGIGGLALTQLGNRSGQPRVQAVLPVAVTSSQLPASAPPAGPPPAQINGVPPGLADQAASTTSAIPTGPVSAAAARIPTEARTATVVVPPPASTLDVKLPPPTPSPAVPAATAATAAATTAAAASTANPAPPPAAPPPPPPPPVRPQVSAQPFPRWLGGGIMNSDNPRGQFVGTVAVRFTVQPNGRVGDCRPVASSGNPALDANTCSLVEQRLRFSPALNAQGEPISTEVRTSYTWGRTTRRR